MSELECAVGRGSTPLPRFMAVGELCWNGVRHLLAIGDTVTEDNVIPLCCRHYHAIVEAYAAFSVERELG